MFTPRKPGHTLARDAMLKPHGMSERFDPSFPVAMRCEKCGKYCHGPRSLMSDAMREHQQSVCPARHRTPDLPQVMRILYPRVKE